MDTTMSQLRSFVHQRLYAAAEEILGEVEKTITLALYEAEVSRSKEEIESLRHQLDFLRNKPAAEPSPTSSTVECGDQCEAPALQENPGPSMPEESNFSLSAEDLGLNQTNTNCCVSDIKEEQEELGDDGQTQEMVFPPPDIVKSEQDQPDTQVSYEMQPVSSDGSAAQNDSDDSDGELVNSKGEQAKNSKRKNKKVRSGNINEKDRAVLLRDRSSAQSDKGRSFCYLCGKGFQYQRSLMNHMKTHEKKMDCTVCGKSFPSTKELVAHLKSSHKTTYFCNDCGKTFVYIHCLRLHKRKHKCTKEFTCQECGKAFSHKSNLIVHVRIHSGEKPYDCDVCGKAFSQSQNLTIHKRSHSGEKPYKCGLCGKGYTTSSTVKVHMRHHTGEKPYRCDICGKSFSQRANMTIHKSRHTGENEMVA